MKVTIKQPVQITVETNTFVNTFDTTVTEEYEIPSSVTLPYTYKNKRVLQLERAELNDSETNEMLERILSQRNEILAAFIAKYNCQPDEIVQVEQMTDSGWIWYVTKKG